MRRLSFRTTRYTVSMAALAMAIISLSAAAHAGAASDEWTRFRGPNGSGISATAFNDPITADDFVWKIDLPGIGHSSPVLRDGRIYLTAGDHDTARRIVLCLAAADGKTIWQRQYDSATFKQHNDNSYASASPAVDELGVYVCWTTPAEYTVIALDHDGKERWKADLGPFVSQWGSGASPTIVGDMVILTDDQEGPKSFAIALDRKTGKTRWKLDRKSGNKTASSTPCLYTPKDGPPQLILGCKACGITSIDPQTGRVNWEVDDVLSARTIGSPIVVQPSAPASDSAARPAGHAGAGKGASSSGALIIATSGEGAQQRELVAIRPGDKPTDPPTVAYKLAKTPPYVPTPLAKGDLLFLWGDNGTVTCVQAATGETVWSEKVGGQFYGSPICAGDTLWCMSRRGKLVGIAASDHYENVCELDLGEGTHATPAVAGGRMYLRTFSHLICVGKKQASAQR